MEIDDFRDGRRFKLGGEAMRRSGEAFQADHRPEERGVEGKPDALRRAPVFETAETVGLLLAEAFEYFPGRPLRLGRRQSLAQCRAQAGAETLPPVLSQPGNLFQGGMGIASGGSHETRHRTVRART